MDRNLLPLEAKRKAVSGVCFSRFFFRLCFKGLGFGKWFSGMSGKPKWESGS